MFKQVSCLKSLILKKIENKKNKDFHKVYAHFGKMLIYLKYWMGCLKVVDVTKINIKIEFFDLKKP